MKYKFDFLLLEFKDIYYILNKIWEEEDLNIINLRLIKLIKEIIITAHLNNKIFYDSDNSLEENIELLYKKDIIPYDLMRYIANYSEELLYFKDLLNNKLSDERIKDYEELIKNEDVIYEACVWLAIKCGEEDYSLFINKLNEEEKNIFNKYINLNDEKDYEDTDNFNSFEMDGFDDDYIEDEEEISTEENLLTGELYYLGKNVEKDYFKAREYFEKAAKEGNEHAESYLGLFYEKGYGGEKDINKALYWYKKAALKGNIFSQYSLGFIYYEGELIEKNLECSFKWYKEAAEKDFAPAQYALSYLYKNGEGCEQNNFKAYYWLEESADNDFEDAYYILGQSYLEGNGIDTNYKKAFFYLSKGASKDDKSCLESLGDMYYWGLYVKEDKEKAFSLYDKSVAEGNIGLYYKIGKLYEAEEKLERALLNYYKGHNNGDFKSSQRLGVMYINGEGVKQDRTKGLEYIKVAVEGGDSHSIYIMGLAFLNEDREKAMNYLLEAYRKGSYYAAEVLAREGIRDYLNKKEVKEVDILGYVNTAMESGLPLGTYYYGLLNHYGISVDKNDEMAFAHFIEAAERGCEEAMLQIANWYKHGIFLSRDIDKAIDWYEKAAEGLNLKAIMELIEIYEKGIGGKEDFIKAYEGALLLKRIDIVEGNLKLAYYHFKGIGVEVSKNKGNKYINELLTINEGRAYNLLGELCEKSLLEIPEEEAVEYYLKAISLGELNGYSNLEYYLYKRGKNIGEYELTEYKEISNNNPKSLYVKAMRKIDNEEDNKDILNEGIELLKESIYLAFYDGINDLINIHKKDKSTEGLINFYKYKSIKAYYNIN